jgi:hypothetical protein
MIGFCGDCSFYQKENNKSAVMYSAVGLQKLEFRGEGFKQVRAAFHRMSPEKEAIFHQK